MHGTAPNIESILPEGGPAPVPSAPSHRWQADSVAPLYPRRSTGALAGALVPAVVGTLLGLAGAVLGEGIPSIREAADAGLLLLGIVAAGALGGALFARAAGTGGSPILATLGFGGYAVIAGAYVVGLSMVLPGLAAAEPELSAQAFVATLQAIVGALAAAGVAAALGTVLFGLFVLPFTIAMAGAWLAILRELTRRGW